MWPGLFYTHLVLPWYGENPLKCPFMILESWLDLQLHFKKQTKKQYGRRDRILFCEIRLEKHLLPSWTPSLVLSFAHEKATFSLERLMWQETEGNLPPATSTKQTSVQQRVRSWETLRSIPWVSLEADASSVKSSHETAGPADTYIATLGET